MQFRPLPVMTFATLVSLAILLWLGSWQYGRFSEKMAREGVEPEWTVLTGETVPDLEVIVYSFTGGDAAWRRMVPVRRDAPDDGLILTTREVIYSIEPPRVCGVMTCPEPERVTLEGVYTAPRGKTMFSGAEDDVQARLFYALDAGIIGAALDETLNWEAFEPRVVPLSERDISRDGPNPFARLGDGDELPPQRHFGYAITWWGLALALLIMYFVFHKSRGRLRFRGRGSE
jgi:surfeit locus 1 family protein